MLFCDSLAAESYAQYMGRVNGSVGRAKFWIAEDSHADRRWRFSIATLTLATLLFGSAMLVWRNWEPYSLAFLSQEDGREQHSVFPPDGRYFCTWKETSSSGSWPNKVYTVKLHVRNSWNGRTVLQREFETRMDGQVQFSPDMQDVYLASGNVYIKGWNIRSGEVMPYQEFTMKPFMRAAFFYSPNQRVLAVVTHRPSDSKLQFFRFPERTLLIERTAEFGESGLGFTPDGKSFATLLKRKEANNDAVRFVSVCDGLTEREWEVEGHFSNLEHELSPDGKFVAVSYYENHKGSIVIYSNDGRRLCEYPGMLPRKGSAFLSGGSEIAIRQDKGTSICRTGTTEKVRSIPEFDVDEISQDGSCLFGSTRAEDLKVFDARNGTLRWSVGRGFEADVRGYPRARFGMIFQQEWGGVADLQSGEHLVTLRGPVAEWGRVVCGTDYFPEETTQYAVSRDAEFYAIDHCKYEKRSLVSHELRVFQKRHATLMWEFWIGFVILCGLAWSMYRDRQSFRRIGLKTG